jgi:hypothetical protein
MKNFLHDLRYSLNAFFRAWQFCRYMRQGGNPDVVQF